MCLNYQCIVRQEPEIGSLLNRFVNEQTDNPGFFLCLVGSDMCIRAT